MDIGTLRGTDTLTKRLRDIGEYSLANYEGAKTVIDDYKGAKTIVNEAADELEALRIEVKILRQRVLMPQYRLPVEHSLVEKVRMWAALSVILAVVIWLFH